MNILALDIDYIYQLLFNWFLYSPTDHYMYFEMWQSETVRERTKIIRCRNAYSTKKDEDIYRTLNGSIWKNKGNRNVCLFSFGFTKHYSKIFLILGLIIVIEGLALLKPEWINSTDNSWPIPSGLSRKW